MNVLRVATIATRTLRVQIPRAHFSVHAILATQEMEHTVKVSYKNVAYLYHKIIRKCLY